MILGGEDVARHPAHVGAKFGQRFDQHSGLHRHMQAAHHARAGQRLLRPMSRTQRHETRHLVLSQTDLFAAPFGQLEIGHFERDAAGLLGLLKRVHHLVARVLSSILPLHSPRGG